MRIGEITNNAEYQISKLKKKFHKFPKFYNYENHRISIIDKLKKK